MTAIDFIDDYEKISKDNKHATYFRARTMFEFAEDYHKAQLKLLGIGGVVVRSEQLCVNCKKAKVDKGNMCDGCIEMYKNF